MDKEDKTLLYCRIKCKGIIYKLTRWSEDTKKAMMSKFRFKIGETCFNSEGIFSKLFQIGNTNTKS